jgi:hypothetical protein
MGVSQSLVIAAAQRDRTHKVSDVADENFDNLLSLHS